LEQALTLRKLSGPHVSFTTSGQDYPSPSDSPVGFTAISFGRSIESAMKKTVCTPNTGILTDL
jgi:hypothetical protein